MSNGSASGGAVYKLQITRGSWPASASSISTDKARRHWAPVSKSRATAARVVRQIRFLMPHRAASGRHGLSRVRHDKRTPARDHKLSSARSSNRDTPSLEPGTPTVSYHLYKRSRRSSEVTCARFSQQAHTTVQPDHATERRYRAGNSGSPPGRPSALTTGSLIGRSCLIFLGARGSPA